jgi:hypothetical protein
MEHVRRPQSCLRSLSRPFLPLLPVGIGREPRRDTAPGSSLARGALGVHVAAKVPR